jgi:hypothetical protein
MYYNRLVELSISMYDWKNLPDTVDWRYLELALFGDGMAVFFKDEELGFLCTRCMIAGNWSVYEIPYERRAYGVNGYQRNDLTPDNSVIIFNNMLHTNSINEVNNFARRLNNLDRAIDVNVNAQKTPVLIKCDEKQRLTLKNMYKEYEGNEPFIFADKSVNTDSFDVLSTNAPFVAPDLYDLKVQIWNEFLTWRGISNINVQKKERLITDEVTRNMGATVASRYSPLEIRRQACEQINNLFGLNIWVDFREDYQEITDELETQEAEESDNIPEEVDKFDE